MKTRNTTQNGVAGAGIIALIALLLILGGVWYWNDARTTVNSHLEEDMEEVHEEMEESMEANSTMHEVRLAGSEEAPLLAFSKEKYEEALASDKLTVLYFYASWCPTCRIEFPRMQKFFDENTEPGVIGFRVNFNDNETDTYEKELAREFGVAYQHTKVFVKDGERILKSPESWDLERYESEIGAFLNN